MKTLVVALCLFAVPAVAQQLVGRDHPNSTDYCKQQALWCNEPVTFPSGSPEAGYGGSTYGDQPVSPALGEALMGGNMADAIAAASQVEPQERQ